MLHAIAVTKFVVVSFENKKKSYCKIYLLFHAILFPIQDHPGEVGFYPKNYSKIKSIFPLNVLFAANSIAGVFK